MTIDFKERATRVHGDKYDYSLSVYKSSKEKVKIICFKHGLFEQTSENHFRGRGCPSCAKNRPLSLTNLQKCNKSLNRQLIDYTIYTCIIHGEQKIPTHAFMKGFGCPECPDRRFGISQISQQWLDNLGIPDDEIHREVKGLFPNRKLVVDGFSPSLNIVYEFWGDFFHGRGPWSDSKNQHLLNRTMKKREIILNSGFHLCEVWESEYKTGSLGSMTWSFPPV